MVLYFERRFTRRYETFHDVVEFFEFFSRERAKFYIVDFSLDNGKSLELRAPQFRYGNIDAPAVIQVIRLDDKPLSFERLDRSGNERARDVKMVRDGLNVYGPSDRHVRNRNQHRIFDSRERKSTRLASSHSGEPRMPSSA